MGNRLSWDNRIRRAEELLDQNPSSSQVLEFYRHVLVLQRQLSERLVSESAPKPGEDASLLEHLELDLALQWLPSLLNVVQKQGPAKLAEESERIAALGDAERRNTLIVFWDADQPGSYTPSRFFARALFQPQAELLASRMTAPVGYQGAVCPFCGSKPQLAILRPEGDGGKRYLACSLCLSEWEYRRIVCPMCDETDHTRLPRYSVEEPIAVRIDACDTCKGYLKSFDMTVNGLMVPEVEEIATVAMDVWAGERGYHKVGLNLLGF